jgi:hypothetical protein
MATPAYKKKPAGAGKTLVARIEAMEQRYDAVGAALARLDGALNEFASLRDDLAALREYQESGQWLRDFEADEAGRIPAGVKRGVLSEDGLYDLLAAADRIPARANEPLFPRQGGGMGHKTK